MITTDYHVHTTYCDGKNPPEETVKKAIELGMTEIGFSGHAGVTPQLSSMSVEDTDNYFNEITALKEKYKDKISILCGIEQDYYSEGNVDRFDYVIGSSHYLLVNGEYIPIDYSGSVLQRATDNYFGGDKYAFLEAYFEMEANVVEKTHATIIGHFDLPSKFIEKDYVFDENNPRYLTAWKKAADKLLTYNIPFEINTGAMSRGYRTSPYPNPEMIEYIRSRGGRFIMNSDCHNCVNLMYMFSKYEYLL